jgi:HPt (histidine-containing phosphotransfer) domain-containing protein/anti-sigma regulatory factor (Ser/Thr protein kinase)
MTEFNPKRVLQESILLFEPKAAEKKNRLKAMIDTDVPEVVLGDPGKLSQILNNLLSNAIKFTQEGLIRVNLEMVSEQPDSIQLEFQVQDTGIGIQEDKILTVFESLPQGNSNTTGQSGGTGLGLPITKQFIEQQGGTIAVESKTHQGSTFTFTLNFKKAAEQGRLAPKPDEKLIDLTYLRELADGDKAFISEIIALFMEQTPQHLIRLQEYASVHKWNEIKVLAHKMKSSVTMIGNAELVEIFVYLEQYALSDQAAEKIPALIDLALQICLDVIAALKTELRVL